MNLKESFRYQNFIKMMFDEARSSITSITHAYNVTKLHKRHEANPAAEDMPESPETPDYHENDKVISLMLALIDEKERLSKAISDTKFTVKAVTGMSLDQDTECNKMRREAASAINRMLSYKSKKTTERGSGYMLNNEGNQVQYTYDVEVIREEAFNRNSDREIMKKISSDADAISTAIDQAMVNYQVEFEPMFEVTDSFDDVMEKFLNATAKEAE